MIEPYLISLRDFMKRWKSIQRTQTDQVLEPLCYYEEGDTIHVYMKTPSAGYHTIYKEGEPIIAEDGRSLDAVNFKLELLSGAIRLLKKPREWKDKYSISIE
jgi:hypothetical protein